MEAGVVNPGPRFNIAKELEKRKASPLTQCIVGYFHGLWHTKFFLFGALRYIKPDLHTTPTAN
jgi:hypothetical protein